MSKGLIMLGRLIYVQLNIYGRKMYSLNMYS